MEELSGASTAVIERQEGELEYQINQSERALGIETDLDRLTEATLFIDRKFLNYSLITGVASKPERIFGDKAWADYLDGRIFAREYGNRKLTPDFIRELHAELTQNTNPEISGEIRSVGIKAGSYDDTSKPVTYTKEQLRAVEENPQLTFRKVPPDDVDGTTGFIRYPHLKHGPETKEAVTKDLEELCEWFNVAKGQDHYNPHIIAGLLQHRLVSLHPFNDSNGTLSRVLMNWSLENDGVEPSAIEDPSEDILTDEETWIAKITEGSKYYKNVKDTKNGLEKDKLKEKTALFNLGQDKAFYNYIFRYLQSAPPLPANGDQHNHQKYEEFLAGFRTEMDRFQEFMASSVSVSSADGLKKATQGGLIAPDYTEFILSSSHTANSSELSNRYLSDVEIFRGGMADGDIDDEKICQMFLEPIGVGTGYRPLRRTHQRATSIDSVSSTAIGETFDYYNKMIADSYFKKKHPDIDNPYSSSGIKDFDATVRDHVSGGKSIWDSPFASTSTDYGVSAGWAKKSGFMQSGSNKHGVLFKARVPKEGIIVTSGGYKLGGMGIPQSGISYEKEILVAGGIPPSAISGIEIYDRSVYGSRLGIIASKVEADGKTIVKIEDKRGEYVAIRTYAYSSESGRFELEGEEPTSIPVQSAIKETGLESSKPLPQLDLTEFAKYLKPKYESPFGDIEKKGFGKKIPLNLNFENESIKNDDYIELNYIPENIIHDAKPWKKQNEFNLININEFNILKEPKNIKKKIINNETDNKEMDITKIYGSKINKKDY
jgi:hypothetical protein